MDEPELKIIDVFICKLRKKLALACGGENYIETGGAMAMCCATWTTKPIISRSRNLTLLSPESYKGAVQQCAALFALGSED